MTLDARLAGTLVRLHPDRAAVVLERIGVEPAVRLLASVTPGLAAAVVERMSPNASTAVLDLLPVDRASALLGALDVDVSARLARHLSEQRRNDAIERLGPERIRALQVLLRFPEGSAGSFMDPAALALADDLTASEALRQVRSAPTHAHYNIYVVDRHHALVGVFNLRELLLSRPRSYVADLMTRNPWRLDAHATRSDVVVHPGWRSVHTLPVVDADGSYLGAVRYATLRALEEELFGKARIDANTGEALGELLQTGAVAILEALTSRRSRPEGP